jgi:hypothetical protein
VLYVRLMCHEPDAAQTANTVRAAVYCIEKVRSGIALETRITHMYLKCTTDESLKCSELTPHFRLFRQLQRPRQAEGTVL